MEETERFCQGSGASGDTSSFQVEENEHIMHFTENVNVERSYLFSIIIYIKIVIYYFRGIVWQLLSGAHDSPVKKQFAEYIKATSACERIIRRDIARTYPEHDFFKEKDGLGQESLFNVMKAYSLHDREVGYCQGSGFIVGLLLMQVSANAILFTRK